MTDYTIRRMDKSDTAKLAELDSVCFSMPWSEQSFAEEAENELAAYFVAASQNGILGYIGCWRVIDEGHITNVAVAPDFRRNGIASALLERIIHEANENNLVLLTLEVRKSNFAAQKLYESFGFKPLGERKAYYHSPREDAVIMTLMLGEN